MGLQIKTFKEILQDMATWVTLNNPKLNNFRPGSAVRTILESVAISMEALYFKMRKAFSQAVEESISNSFSFYPQPALASSGTVTVEFKNYLEQRLTIPKFYRFSTLPVGGKVVYFEAIDDVLCQEGTISAVINVRCVEAGTVGNVPANSITLAVTPLAVMSRIYNSEGFINGEAAESKEEYKKRFNQFIETLARGTLSSIQYGCLKVPGVSGAYVSDQIGEVKAYVHDAAGNLSPELRKQVEDALIDYRPAGTGVLVLPVNKIPVDVGMTVTLKAGFDNDRYREIIRTSVTSFLNNFVVSKSLTRAELITHVMGIDKNAIINVVLTLNHDVNVISFELIRAGNISVTVQK